jgi:hypothetical protein
MYNSNIIETFSHKGVEVTIGYDDYPIDPRNNYDYLGSMICFHSRYTLGDKHNFSSVDELFEEISDRNAYPLVMPLFLYDHSGITISVGDFNHIDPGGWDSGMVGVAYMTADTIKETWGTVSEETLELAKTALVFEVDEYDSYLTGQVYYYSAEAGDISDSCHGYIGHLDIVRDEAIAAADWIATQVESEDASAKIPVDIWG